MSCNACASCALACSISSLVSALLMSLWPCWSIWLIRSLSACFSLSVRFGFRSISSINAWTCLSTSLLASIFAFGISLACTCSIAWLPAVWTWDTAWLLVALLMLLMMLFANSSALFFAISLSWSIAFEASISFSLLAKAWLIDWIALSLASCSRWSPLRLWIASLTAWIAPLISFTFVLSLFSNVFARRLASSKFVLALSSAFW